MQEICDRTGLHQGNVSKHLQMMKAAGVVTCRREGVWRYYRVIDTDLLALCERAHLQVYVRPSPPEPEVPGVTVGTDAQD